MATTSTERIAVTNARGGIFQPFHIGRYRHIRWNTSPSKGGRNPTAAGRMLVSSTYHADDGAAYELFLGRCTRRLAPPLLDFAEFSNAGTLLDVGTGTGSLAFAMAARWPGRSVLGIDTAAPYVAYARSQVDGAQPDFATGDAAALRHD